MSFVQSSVGANGVAILELNRPEVLNVLNAGLMEEVIALLAKWAEDEAVLALILTGRGRAFCAGADLAADGLLNLEGNTSRGEFVAGEMKKLFNPMTSAIYNFPKPKVVSINGIAAGGGVALALCGDITIAAKTSSLKIVQVQQLGIVADLGAHWLLQNAVGRAKAMAMCLLGDTIPAQQLLEEGLVLEVLEQEELLTRAQAIAEQLARVPAATVLATRQLMDKARNCSFDQALEDERMAQRNLCDNAFFLESIREFFGKGGS